VSDWHSKKRIKKRGGWGMKAKALLNKLEWQGKRYDCSLRAEKSKAILNCDLKVAPAIKESDASR
jgi:hypothetical protein